ncbi:MAG: hypothetical protein H7Y16_10165 [Candidatus Parcubacteria bacterium]|nr:hypothetical protein [Burkholderiales bacterium]
MDAVTDLIASIEMHRKEIEKETGLEASRSYSLGRLQQALKEEQDAAQQQVPGAERAAIAEALASEIRRVTSLSRSAGPRPQQGRGDQGGRPQQQQRNFRQDQQRKPPKSRGRRPMGRSTGR